jgi:hypothetical protein
MRQPSCHTQRLAWTGGLLSLLVGGAAVAEYPVAGTQPYARPVGAPRITTVTHDQAWFARALHGVSAPYPPSLGFLDSQGNWYTPFNRPGMLPPYDIRGWHAAPAPR